MLSKSQPAFFPLHGRTVDSLVVILSSHDWSVSSDYKVPDNGVLTIPDSLMNKLKVGDVCRLVVWRSYYHVVKSRHGRTVGHIQRMFFMIGFRVEE